MAPALSPSGTLAACPTSHPSSVMRPSRCSATRPRPSRATSSRCRAPTTSTDVFVDTDRNPTRGPQPRRAARPRPPRAARATCRSCPSTRASSTRAAASLRAEPGVLRPENIVKLAIEGGCNAVASTFGVLGMASRRYAHKIPFIVKINHNELLTYPNQFDQVLFGNVQQAWDMGAVGVGATIYFGSEESTRQMQEVSEAFAEAHELGMVTVLWCYLRNNAFKKDGVDYSRRRRPDRPGQPPRRHDPGRHHQAEAAREQRRLHGAQLRQDVAARLRRADDRPPDRPLPLAGRELLHGPHRADQLRRRVEGRGRPRRKPCAPRSSTSAPAAWA